MIRGFVVVLALAAAQGADLSVTIEATVEQTTSSEIVTLATTNHPILRKGSREVIEGESDFEVVAEAGNGLAGLDFIEKLHPSIAVLDLHMPKVDGSGLPRRSLSVSSAPKSFSSPCMTRSIFSSGRWRSERAMF